MEESLNPFARQAAQEAIVAKRDKLLAERGELMEQRSEILARIRRAERELADCRAAARLFQLDIDFPEEDERAVSARREYDMIAEREERLRQISAHRLTERTREATQKALGHALVAQATTIQAPLPAAAPAKRPPLREVLLDQLRQAGEGGAKAADLREYFERTYGVIIHEKTVGMTLYRLSKDMLVHRDGHTWFFGPSKAGTENPGGGTPGPEGLV